MALWPALYKLSWQCWFCNTATRPKCGSNNYDVWYFAEFPRVFMYQYSAEIRAPRLRQIWRLTFNARDYNLWSRNLISRLRSRWKWSTITVIIEKPINFLVCAKIVSTYKRRSYVTAGWAGSPNGIVVSRQVEETRDLLQYYSWLLIQRERIPRGMTPLKIAYEISNHHNFWLDFWFPSWFLISKLISDFRIFEKLLPPTWYKLLYYVPALVLVIKS